jgi:molybdenum cofactor guanylyltransferase
VRIDGIILAGGASSRMGMPKPLLPFGGKTLIDAVIARAVPQVHTLAINVAPEDAESYRAQFPYLVLPDVYKEKLGPLCGIITGLQWCKADWLASFPCDTPFIPRNLVAQLARKAHDFPVVAVHGTDVHNICALWPKSALPRLVSELSRFRNMHATLQAFGAVECQITASAFAFLNINEPTDLSAALRLSGSED